MEIAAYNYGMITAALAGEMKRGRWLHTLGVVETAAVLARIGGGDVERACVAGLLHDCARGLPDGEIARLAAEDECFDDWTGAYPALLHAFAGAVIARRRFGVLDPEVLTAVRYHPTGCRMACPTLKVLMVADYCEPTRVFPGVEDLRRVARQDQRLALRHVLQAKMAHLAASGRAVHPRTREMFDDVGCDGKEQDDRSM